MHRIAAALIVGDSWEPKNIKTLLASLEPHIHGIFVSYNGKEKKFPRWSKYTSLPITWGRTEWTDDFSAARNHSFSLVPREYYDWILWIDTDDKLVVEGDLQEILNSLDPYTQGLFLRYAYAVDPDTGLVIVEQWRERLLSTSVDWSWKFPIHEVCVGPAGTQFGRRDGVYIEHLRLSGNDASTRARNRRIIARSVKKNPNEPRYVFYFANELMAEADMMHPGPERDVVIDSAIKTYWDFLKIASQTDDYYNATCRIADLHYMKKEWEKSINVYLQAIKFYPSWPDAYVGVAKAFMEMGDYDRMFAFADLATKAPKPTTAAAIEPMNSGFTPYLLRGIANEELGRLEEALADYEHAAVFWNPPNGVLSERTTNVKTKIANGASESQDEQEKLNDLRKSLRGSKQDKSICFFTQYIPEAWHPKLEAEGGAGGAETCIMRLAPYFAADGWRVVVFGTPGSENRGIYDGVEYWNADEWLPNEEFTVFVSSRAPECFDSNLRAKHKMLWMHDVNLRDRITSERLNNVDQVIALTNWHASHLSRLYSIPRDDLVILPNGIDIDLFDYNYKNKPDTPKFVYSSSPDRGLDVLLGMWPEIKKIWPKATLDIYYGWNLIDKIIEASNGQHFLAYFKDGIISTIEGLGGEEGGIFQRGRIPQAQLAKELKNKTIWAYPTYFMETFCITALEMQAAGVIPVTSRLAALNETVAVKSQLVEGWPNNVTYQDEWMVRLQASLVDTNMANLKRELGRTFAQQFSWDKVYDRWAINLSRVGVLEPKVTVSV